MTNIFPIINNLHDLSQEVIYQFIVVGFCYVRLPEIGSIGII
ncbi:hypothetical protein [Legionella drozanskii]|nr:hypothetical protein [Legionella drozanskii]